MRPDWSSKGLGYFLTQKHCNCKILRPDCCEDGWVIVLAGSRFLSGAEKRYAPIEGEAVAIAWGLEQCKYFTLGCKNLLVVTDHKPLVKIFGDRTLDESQNTKIFRIKQRTLPWYFQIMYMPGSTNQAADAASRNPSSECSQISCDAEDEEGVIVASIHKEIENTMTITWEHLVSSTLKDKALSKLLHAIENDLEFTDPLISQFNRYKEALYSYDGVVMYKDRVIVPEDLRPLVLQSLHAAHQGVSSMELRAHSLVFWPGMTRDIHQIRSNCATCNKNAPSNSRVPHDAPDPPTLPFEKIFSDFFHYGGNYFLVIGDRLSGWSEVFSVPRNSCNSGSSGLITCLRRFFITFGVPQELSSDGGPEFKSDTTSKFLKDWGVFHRISSAYYPESNGRAEVAVKSAKRLLRDNTGPSGSLNSDKFLKAMLQLRNTPDPDCNLSPAEIIYGHPLRDTFTFSSKLEKFSNKCVRKSWREAWAAKENALKVRFAKSTEKLNQHARELPPLGIGEKCFVQNQCGNHRRRWDKSGVVTEKLPHDKYLVKIDGSGHVTQRNRRFLKVYTPAATKIQPNIIPSLLPDNLPIPSHELPPAEPEVSSAPDNIKETHMEVVSPEATVNRPQKIPLMLRRLNDHMKPGPYYKA